MLSEGLRLNEIAAALGCAEQDQRLVFDISTDSRSITGGCVFVAIEGEQFDGHRFAAQALAQGAVRVVAHKPVDCPPEQVYQVADTKDALIALGGLYRRRFTPHVVGVTGSVGKTTTKEMVAQVLAHHYRTLKNEGNQNNEIGVPKTLFGLTRETEAAVIEMGMTALGDVRKLALAAQPQLGVITSVGVSHIERLGSRENILRAKLELADCLPAGAPLLLCGDNDLLQTVVRPDRQLLFYGVRNPQNQITALDITENQTETAFTILYDKKRYPAVLPLLGVHNVQNALAAFGVGMLLQVPPEEILLALREYRTAGMRQRVVHHHELTVVEDCYNASPDSMAASLRACADMPCRGRRFAVLSDMLELGELSETSHREVGRMVARLGIHYLFAYGPQARYYREGALEVGGCEAHWFAQQPEMAACLVDALRPGDLIWVKGSRGMHLEDTIKTLYEEC